MQWHSGAGGVTVGSTLYFGLGEVGANEADFCFPAPVSGRLKNLYVRTSQHPEAGKTWNYTVRKNGVDTHIMALIDEAAAGQAQDTANAVSVAAGDRISIKVVSSAGAATGGGHSVTLALES